MADWPNGVPLMTGWSVRFQHQGRTYTGVVGSVVVDTTSGAANPTELKLGEINPG
ncbi:MAG: hypothetical protein IAI50_16210 [Candidatus Eremiobacteraeota bacterium]|nr:hypothetical protein [Candidatus Eremiobacteraeota bacterium]